MNVPWHIAISYLSEYNDLFIILDACMVRYDVPVELRLFIKQYLYATMFEHNFRGAVEMATDSYSFPLERRLATETMLRYGPIEWYDTSRITDMTSLFSGILSVERNVRFLDLSNWKTHNVRLMPAMFANCIFNPQSKIENWDVSNVINLQSMFSNCRLFNRPIQSWNVSKVKRASYLFHQCDSFNQPLHTWNTSNFLFTDLMFAEAENMEWDWPIEDWDMSNVVSAVGMFKDCVTLNRPLNSWNVSKLKYACNMFSGALIFNQPLSSWNTSNVIDMKRMFYKCIKYNQPMNDWDVSKVETTEEMFHSNMEFNQPLNKWKLSKCVDTTKMFRSCRSFNQDLREWFPYVPGQYHPRWDHMFQGCKSLNQDFYAWHIVRTIQELKPVSAYENIVNVGLNIKDM